MAGLVAILICASGFLFEYYVGINRSQSQTLSSLDASGLSATSSRKLLNE